MMIGFELGMIDTSVRIGRNVEIGNNVTIGCSAIVYDNVCIGDNTIIGPNCVVGEPIGSYYSDTRYINPQLRISKDSIIRSGSILYAGSNIGERFQCGNCVTIRENCKIGKNCRIGTISDLEGYCKLGDYCRLHSNVHIGQKSSIGNFVWIYPYVVLTNDPHPPSDVIIGVTVEDFSVIATMAVILPGIHIGKDALVGAHALVREDVEAGVVVAGNPAKQISTIRDIKTKRDGKEVYPWREHFDRGMPWEGIGYQSWNEKRKACVV